MYGIRFTVRVEAVVSSIQFMFIIVQDFLIMTVTNYVTRFLDAHKVQYSAHKLPPEKLGAVEAAVHMGEPPAHVFKTIVLTREKKKPLLIVIPCPRGV